MTEAERQMGQALGRCAFVPASFDKRWCRAIAFVAAGEEPSITPKEAELLRTMVQRYRRQIEPAVVALAADPAPEAAAPPAAPLAQLEILE